MINRFRRSLGVLICLGIVLFAFIAQHLFVIATQDEFVFRGGEAGLKHEILDGLRAFDTVTKVSDMQIVMETSDYMQVLYLTEDGQFGDAYYEKNQNWVKSLARSRGEPVSRHLVEMNRWCVYSENKAEVVFDEMTLTGIDRSGISLANVVADSMVSKTITLGAQTENEKTIYIAWVNVNSVG